MLQNGVCVCVLQYDVQKSGLLGMFIALTRFSLSYLCPFSGVFDEMQSALSSPGLDSPNSSADITLDTTGELTVEDVKDFLVWVLGLQTSWQTPLICSHIMICVGAKAQWLLWVCFFLFFFFLSTVLCVALRIAYCIRSTCLYLFVVGVWMRLRITWGIWARRMEGFLGFLSTDHFDTWRWVLLKTEASCIRSCWWILDGDEGV